MLRAALDLVAESFGSFEKAEIICFSIDQLSFTIIKSS
jgi:hypothetical protein